MASIGGIGSASMEILPYVLMTLRFAGNAVLMAFLRFVLSPSSGGVNPVVFAAYQQLVATAVLSAAVLLFDLRKGIARPSVEILLYASLIGFLQYPIGEILLTSSLRYVTATFQSIGLNMIPAVVFVAAVACRRERFRFREGYSQAKLWGALVAIAGSTVVVMSDRGTAESSGSVADIGVVGGGLMVGAAVVALSASCILVESVAMKYPSNLSLSTMITTFGTLQTVVIALIMERDLTSWRMRWTNNRVEMLAILHGGIAVSGLLYLGHNWCIHKKGPVFASAFSPLVVVFSFLIETFILGGDDTQFGSVIGAAMVIGGLYLLLWAKAKDSNVVEGSCTEPLLLIKA